MPHLRQTLVAEFFSTPQGLAAPAKSAEWRVAKDLPATDHESRTLSGLGEEALVSAGTSPADDLELTAASSTAGLALDWTGGTDPEWLGAAIPLTVPLAAPVTLVASRDSGALRIDCATWDPSSDLAAGQFLYLGTGWSTPLQGLWSVLSVGANFAYLSPTSSSQAPIAQTLVDTFADSADLAQTLSGRAAGDTVEVGDVVVLGSAFPAAARGRRRVTAVTPFRLTLSPGPAVPSGVYTPSASGSELYILFPAAEAWDVLFLQVDRGRALLTLNGVESGQTIQPAANAAPGVLVLTDPIGVGVIKSLDFRARLLLVRY